MGPFTSQRHGPICGTNPRWDALVRAAAAVCVAPVRLCLFNCTESSQRRHRVEDFKNSLSLEQGTRHLDLAIGGTQAAPPLHPTLHQKRGGIQRLQDLHGGPHTAL